MAGDICIIKVFFDTCDKPILSPVRVIIDEKTARHGLYLIQFDLIRFVDIYSHPKFPFIIQIADACYIFGYGSETLSGDPTLDLRLAPVKIISHESCMKELGPWNAPELDSGMFCAIGEYPGVDACPVITNARFAH